MNLLKTSRNRKGSVLPVTISLTLALAVLGAGLCQLLLTMGAGNEVQSAVNAGALRVGQHVLTVADTTGEADRDQFKAIGWTGKDGQPHFTVGNVNRAIAKAMLIRANVNDMKLQGPSELAEAHAKQVECSANRIVESVKNAVSDRKNLEGEFCTFANSNSLRMGMFNTQVQPTNDKWETAYLDGGAESNITFNKEVLPPSQQNAVCPITKGNKSYIKGYENNQLSNLRMIPFRRHERPTLVSAHDFSQHIKPAVNTDIPNSWACHGFATSRSGMPTAATAMVETNPQQDFDMRATDGWIRVILHPNDLIWYQNGFNIGRETYPHHTLTLRKKRFYIPLWNIAKAYAVVGNEYQDLSMWKALWPLSGASGATEPRNALLQRMKELRPDMDNNALSQVLKDYDDIERSSEQDQVFYIYLNKDNKITISREGAPEIPSYVRQYAKPDGEHQTFEQKYKSIPNIPNFSYASIEIGPRAGQKIISFTTTSGDIDWTPGSGYDGCLGQIEHRDYARCWTFGGGI